MRIPLALLSATLIALLCGGCKSSTNPDSNSSSSGGNSTGNSGGTSGGGTGSTMTALIDGVRWNPTSVSATYHMTDPPYFGVDSSDAAFTLLSIAFGKFGKGQSLTTGSYDIGPTDTNGNYVLVGGSHIWTAFSGAGTLAGKGSGAVVLNTFSLTTKRASGTFHFVLVDAAGATKTVTNGTFDVAFP